MSIVALDLGGSHITCGIVRDAHVLASFSVETDAHSLRNLLPELARRLKAICDCAGFPVAVCKGVGIGFPAVIDGRTNEILATHGKFTDVTREDLQEWCAYEFALPMKIENDVKLALLGEHAAGAARGFEDVVMVTLGTGIGAAAMLQNRLLRSHMGQAGTLGGHLSVSFGGRPCKCGAIGCAEAEASTAALPVMCLDWPGFPDSMLARESRLDFATLFRAKDAGDSVARELLRHCIEVWSALAVNLVNAYGPQILLFGGGVMERGEEILGAIRAYVEQHAWRTSRGMAQIEAATLGQEAALIGAEALFSVVSV